MDTFGKRLKSLRQDKKLTQAELANILSSRGVNISHAWISMIETQPSANPTTEVLIALADVLETSTDYLLARTHELPQPELA